jgi:DNA processing protein
VVPWARRTVIPQSRWTDPGFCGIMAAAPTGAGESRTKRGSTGTRAMNRLEWIALAWHGGIGPAAFRKLVARFGTPRAAAEAGEDALWAAGARLSASQIRRIGSSMDAVPLVAAEIDSLAQDSVTVLCSFEDAYPSPLVEIPTAPPVVCFRGGWQEADTQAVAIVGTRSPTDEGRRLAEDVAAACVEAGLTVVSGLALGIDTCAHGGALAAEGRTVAVLGSGIRVIRPAENAALAGRIARSGAVLSELPPRARPTARSLMARNRLQSALSKAVLVVESREQGGSLQTARYALRQGRLLVAVDWREGKPTAAGPRILLREGALPLRSAEDVPELAQRIKAHVPVLRERARRLGRHQPPLM